MEELLDFAFESRKRDRQGRAARIDDNRPLGIQLRKVQAHGFAKAALDTVSNIGAAERTRSGEADARRTGAGLRDRLGAKTGEVERGKMSAGIALAGVINFSEVAGS